MWTTFRNKRVLNIFSPYLNKNEYDCSMLKQNSNDMILQKYINLNNKNRYECLDSNEGHNSNKAQSDFLSYLNIKGANLSQNKVNGVSSIMLSEGEKTFGENNLQGSKFSKFLGLVGSTLLGYFAMKSKNLRNEKVKVKDESIYDNNQEINNFRNEEVLIRNSLRNRVSSISYAANNPIEDRYNAIQLKNIEGYFVEVLDGHGGYQVAEYASKRLHIYFDEKIKELNEEKNLSEDEKIITALNHAFASVEQDLYKHAKDSFAKGFTDFIFVGACALAIVVHDNKLYVANCGDSKAKMYNFDGFSYNPIKLSRTLNAGAKKEQMRLRNEYSDSDIFICKRSYSKACYVKGRLQPTRSLGDFYLKHEEFNLKEIRKSMKNFIKGPYINHLPEIKIFNLNKNDRFIVLATDGLWDELTPLDVAKVIKENDDSKDKIIDNLFRNALNHAALDANMTLEQILNVEQGRRKRSLHDDITILIVDLKNQFN